MSLVQTFTFLEVSPDTFDYTNDTNDTTGITKKCLLNGVWALNELKLWDWLRNYNPDEKKGFMFSRAEELQQISAKMDRLDAPVTMSHSGASFALTMNALKHIATHGLDGYRSEFLFNAM
jgi:hypothetical protein